jgi:NAD(P)-dependent dehydrogenase (short-subunit alcohol dehydrogenase family)
MAYASEGASVVVADINVDGAKEVAAQVQECHGPSHALHVDLADEVSIERMVEEALGIFGRIDVLHNNAAALHLLANDGDLLDLDSAVAHATFEVNVVGPMMTCKHLLPSMLERGHGVIINTASMAGVQADEGKSCYAASKAALLSLTRSIATMYGMRGIRCNAIVPATMVTASAAEQLDAEALRLRRSERLLNRSATPEDFAGVCLFLACDESAYVQGQAVIMDGGALAHRPLISVQAALRSSNV